MNIIDLSILELTPPDKPYEEINQMRELRISDLPVVQEAKAEELPYSTKTECRVESRQRTVWGFCAGVLLNQRGEMR